jgi:hypothetical protein
MAIMSAEELAIEVNQDVDSTPSLGREERELKSLGESGDEKTDLETKNVSQIEMLREKL